MVRINEEVLHKIRGTMNKILLVILCNVFMSCALLQPKAPATSEAIEVHVQKNEVADLLIRLIENVESVTASQELTLKEQTDSEKRRKIVYKIQSRTKTYEARCELEIFFFNEMKRYVFKIEKISLNPDGRVAQTLEIKTSNKQELISLIRDNF